MIHDLFKVHRLNEAGLSAAMQLADDFSQFLLKVEWLCGGQGNQREMAIVRTKLQEACFFAKRALALNPALQEPVATVVQ
jgi:hypothetical protein